MRPLTDDALLLHLAGYLMYEARGGHPSFSDWADRLATTQAERTFLEVAYLGAKVLPAMVAC